MLCFLLMEVSGSASDGPQRRPVGRSGCGRAGTKFTAWRAAARHGGWQIECGPGGRVRRGLAGGSAGAIEVGEDREHAAMLAGARGDAEFAHDAGDVLLDGVLGDGQRL